MNKNLSSANILKAVASFRNVPAGEGLVDSLAALKNQIFEIKGEYFGEDEEEFGEHDDNVFKQDLANLASNLVDLVNSRLLRYVKWTETEEGWILIKKEAEEVIEPKKLFNAIFNKLKESFAGEFIHKFNKIQPVDKELQEDKISIIKTNLALNEFPNTYERSNYCVDDMIKLLETCIKNSSTGIITLRLLLSKIPLLRLTNCQISMMDKSLMNNENIQALILACNYLTDFPGYYLPKNLKILELYGNVLYNIELLCTDAPPNLLYLGIGRNRLNHGKNTKKTIKRTKRRKSKSGKRKQKKKKSKKGIKKSKAQDEEKTKKDNNDKKKKKGKKRQTKRKTENKEKNNDEKKMTKDKNGSLKGEEKEIDMAKDKVIAKIAIPLEVLKWNEVNMGYIWDIKRHCLARPFLNIQDVKYKIPGKSKKSKKHRTKTKKTRTKAGKQSKKGKKSKNNKKTLSKKKKNNEEKLYEKKEDEKKKSESVLRDIPPYLTCHFAIGLKRDTSDAKTKLSKSGMRLKNIPLKKRNLKQPKKIIEKKSIRMEKILLVLLQNLIDQNETYTHIKNEYMKIKPASKILRPGRKYSTKKNK